MVANSIEEKKDEIAALCREYGVRALWVFGSATTDRFDPATSDIDFLVDLGEYEVAIARRYSGLLHALEAALGRSVDLITVRSTMNPYFREELEETKVLVYGARKAEIPA